MNELAVETDQNAATDLAPVCPDVNEIVDILVSDYNDVSTLGFHVFQIGEEYYYRGQKAQIKGGSSLAKADFEKAIGIWCKNINQIADTRHQVMAHYATGVCYRYLGNYSDAADSFMISLEMDPRQEFAGSMHWLVSDCYEKLKRDGQVSADEADPIIEWGYRTLFERYPDSRDVEYAALKLGKLHLARGEPVSACVYFNWFLDHTAADNGQIADIGRILERMEGCSR